MAGNHDGFEAILALIAAAADVAQRAERAVEPTLAKAFAELQRAADAGRATLDRWIEDGRRAADAARPAIEGAGSVLASVLSWLGEHGPKIAEVLSRMQYLAAHAHVENWAGLQEDDWMAAFQLMRADDGVPLAWVPPADVVVALVMAVDHEDRDRVCSRTPM